MAGQLSYPVYSPNTATFNTVQQSLFRSALFTVQSFTVHVCVYTDENFKAKFLESHNEYRKKHGAPEVTYNEELCSTAQKWADHLLSIKTLKHSETDDGENVYYSWSSSPKKLTGRFTSLNTTSYNQHPCDSVTSAHHQDSFWFVSITSQSKACLSNMVTLQRKVNTDVKCNNISDSYWSPTSKLDIPSHNTQRSKTIKA